MLGYLRSFYFLIFIYCYKFLPKNCFCSTLSEKAMAPHSSTLAWKIPWTEEPGRLQSMASLRVRHNWATSLSLVTFTHWRRKWQPTPVFLPGKSQGGEPGGLPSLGSQRVRHDWSDLAVAVAAPYRSWCVLWFCFHLFWDFFLISFLIFLFDWLVIQSGTG